MLGISRTWVLGMWGVQNFLIQLLDIWFPIFSLFLYFYSEKHRLVPYLGSVLCVYMLKSVRSNTLSCGRSFFWILHLLLFPSSQHNREGYLLFIDLARLLSLVRSLILEISRLWFTVSHADVNFINTTPVMFFFLAILYILGDAQYLSITWPLQSETALLFDEFIIYVCLGLIYHIVCRYDREGR